MELYAIAAMIIAALAAAAFLCTVLFRRRMSPPVWLALLVLEALILLGSGITGLCLGSFIR